jgi:hypothetical protein
MARHSREDWAKRIERWKDSGLTAAEFAAETGINAHSLSWWQWKLSADAKTSASAAASPSQIQANVDEGKSGRRRRRPRSSEPSDMPSATTMTFVEVTPSQRSEALEVKLTGGREVRVPVGFDAPTLERLLAILERRA